MSESERIKFLNEDGDFIIRDPEAVSGLYFPLAGEAGLKSAVTPQLGGDSKIDQETFLLEPVSTEDLRNSRSTRNFWCVTDDGIWSAAGASAQQEADRFGTSRDENSVTAGLMWHSLRRTSAALGLEAVITMFVPDDENAEVMHVSITNISDEPKTVTGIAAIPLYGRSADNYRDHRNVTSMLHRITVTDAGVLVKPTMSFDEKGHRLNNKTYYTVGIEDGGQKPDLFYPTAEIFLGEEGTFLNPQAVHFPERGVPAGTGIGGREAVGGFRFPAVTIDPGRSVDYIVITGVTDEDAGHIDCVLDRFSSSELVLNELDKTKKLWQDRVNIRYMTGDPDFDNYMRWVSFQPFLRRLYGCSFLPDHDYGRGGRGWRDLWQDCLSLLLMDPSGVREMITANFGGVRFDGTNATIIGSGLGNFIADRNGIARVWMDHALWPLMTVKMYIDQSGDIGILSENAPYFKDTQAHRGTGIDADWDDAYGQLLRTADGEIYEGSILEHLLIQHLAGFPEVGAHNIYRLRGADWNDALDMASENGESVAFTCAYAGNMKDLASILRTYAAATGRDTAEVAEELLVLMPEDRSFYDDIAGKAELLDEFTSSCIHTIGGRKAEISLAAVADELEARAAWITDHVREQEWIQSESCKEGWFNSYYDNSGNKVEGVTDAGVRMMLIGQVFSIMSGVASDEETASIIRSADRYLYRPEIGGYRLNTDFHELKMDMGRMFGFAYGEKENGAVFSHMAVMYANALYKRGYVKEGWKALSALSHQALDFDRSRIYPGIPEYFNIDGRGRYHYLTGAASWYMMTVVTEIFGVKGRNGDLELRPKLLKEQFDDTGKATVELIFAGKQLEITYINVTGKEHGDYHIERAYMTSSDLQVKPACSDDEAIIFSRDEILSLPSDRTAITVWLA